MVTFLYHDNPIVENIGDSLCTPKLYFDFKSEAPVRIVGGGSISDYWVRRKELSLPGINVAWGIGRSVRPEQSLKFVKKYFLKKEISKIYTVSSTRDPSFSDKNVFLVPCVSVFNAITDLPVGDKLGLFLNSNKDVSGNNINQIINKYIGNRPEIVIGSNSLCYDDFLELFKHTNEIITNSYHIAYWSLLSGRRVRLLGYSSKFADLLNLFKISTENMFLYKRGDYRQMLVAIDNAFNENKSIAAHSYFKEQFRSMNLEFASLLNNYGVSVHLKPAIKNYIQ